MSITVIVPAYNAVRFMREAIDSALRQTYPVDEVLVVNDGSTDDTVAVAESYGAPVRVISQANSKLAATRNFGVQHATTEWVAFLDADDIWEPHKIERQMEELAKRPEADVCYTGWTLLLQNGETTELGRVFEVPPPEKLREALFERVAMLPSTVVMRRSTYMKFGGFNTQQRYSEDYEMWLRLLHGGVEFAACHEPLMLYRRHGSNTVTGFAWMTECLELHQRYIHPYLPKTTRWMARNVFASYHEEEAAFTLRRLGDPRAPGLMARAILHRPFFSLHRYKVLLHMLWSRLFKTAGKA